MKKIAIALEWFQNPDHLPIMVAINNGYFNELGLDVVIIEPDEHYDGFDALKNGSIEFAINEPLHLIEQFDSQMLSLGTFFQTRGGVLLSKDGEGKLRSGKKIVISTPVDNPKTDAIAREILKRYLAKLNIELNFDNVVFEKTDFYHIPNIKKGYDGGWLVFYNFEVIEANYEKIETILIEAKNANFPNFSALDIFTTKNFYNENRETIANFLKSVARAIQFIKSDKENTKEIYYKMMNEEKSELMDSIIEATIECFDDNIISKASNQKEILEFFHYIGISDLEYNEFKSAFIEE